MLRLERDAWSMVKRLRQATNEYAPAPLQVFQHFNHDLIMYGSFSHSMCSIGVLVIDFVVGKFDAL